MHTTQSEQDPHPAGQDPVRSALEAIALLSRVHGHRLNMTDLAHRHSAANSMSRWQLVGVLRDSGFRARLLPLDRRNLRRIPLPAIVTLKDGTYALLLSVEDGVVQWRRPGHDGLDTLPIRAFRKLTSGWAILARPESRTAREGDGRSSFSLGWFLRTLLRYRGVMREALLASVFLQLFALATPIVFMLVIDKVFTHNNLSTLDVLVFALVVVSLFDVLLGGIRTYLMSHTGNRVDVELGMRLFRHLMKLPLSYFESRTSGDTVSRVRELETVRQFLTGSTLTLLVDVVFVVVFLAVMYLFSARLTTIVLLALPLFFVVSLVVTPWMRNRLEDRHQLAAENQSFLVETLVGIESVKANAMEASRERDWASRLAQYAESATASAHLANLINQLIALLSKALTIGLLYLGAKLVLNGDLSVGQLIAFNMLSGRVVAPIQRMAQLWQELTSTRVALRRLSDIMDAPVEPSAADGDTVLPAIRGQVRFDRVAFRYDEQRPDVLEDISFTVEPGELVGVIGPTGAGKSTLIKLLQRLYAPTRGVVSIDGFNLFGVSAGWLRQQVGVVSQDGVLFHRSIRENITRGRKDIDDARVIEVARVAGAHEWIAALPEGYDTVVQERGRGLSAGQRQAVALARALVNDPAVLVLDEATSALDYETEQAFWENLHRVRGQRTIFVVAHRLSSVQQADRILTIENGHLAENASPAQLAGRGGGYDRFRALHALGEPGESDDLGTRGERGERGEPTEGSRRAAG